MSKFSFQFSLLGMRVPVSWTAFLVGIFNMVPLLAVLPLKVIRLYNTSQVKELPAVSGDSSCCFRSFLPRLKSLTVLIIKGKVLWIRGWCFLLLLVTCQHYIMPFQVLWVCLIFVRVFIAVVMYEIWLVIHSYTWGIVSVISLRSS